MLERLGSSVPLRLFLAAWLLFAVHAQDGWSTNSNRYVALVHAVALEGRLEISTWRETTIDTSYVDGRWYAGASPGPAAVLLPFYGLFRAAWPLAPEPLRAKVGQAVATRLESRAGEAPSGFDLAEFALSVQFLTLAVPPLAGASLALVLYGFFRRKGSGERQAALLAFVSVAGTIVFHYSTVIFSHVLAALAAFLAFDLVDRTAGERGAVDRSWIAFAAGFAAAAATAMDYLAAVATIGVGLFALVRLPGRRLAAFAAGAFAAGGLLAAYQAEAFGRPWLTPYSFPTGVEGRDSHDPVTTGFFGMDRPRPGVVLELLGGTRRGYFLHMPLLAAGFAGLVLAIRRGGRDRLPAAVAAGLFAAFLLLNASMASEFFWLAGTSFGPRYLLPTVPFVAAGLAFLPWGRRDVRAGVAGLAAASILVGWLGALFGASDAQSRFPLVDRFLPLLVAEGPQPTLVRNLGGLAGVPISVRVAAGFVLTLATAAAVVALLFNCKAPIEKGETSCPQENPVP